MSASAAPSTDAPTRASGGFLDSPLNRGLAVLALVVLAFVQNGYVALRFDHVVQLPYLLMEWEPGLYARDWYLQNDPHDRIRFFHLLLIRLAAAPLGLELGILALYVLFLGATFAAWLSISRRLYGSSAAGVVVSLLAIFLHGWELGANQLAENTFIPRMEAYAFSYAGLALLLAGRSALGGLAFALGGLFQPAVPLQFAGVAALWILIGGDRPRLPAFLKFSAAYWALSLPWMLWLRGTVTGESGLSSAEILHIFAVVRHPAHMIPSTWSMDRWAMTALLLAAFALAWPRLRAREPGAWRFGLFVPLLVALLAVSLLFIEIVPVRWIVLFQPFRAAVLMYFVLFVIVAPEILRLAASDGVPGRLRSAALMVAAADPRILAPALLLALVLEMAERRREPLGGKLELAIWFVAALALAAFYPWLRMPIALGALLAAGLVLRCPGRPLSSPRALRTALFALAMLAIGALAVFRAAPWERWMLRGAEGRYNAVDRLLMKTQLRVIMIPGIERMAAWVRENTPRDALFLIPPDRNQWGFRLFARRAQVFDVKSIPYHPAGIEEWWRRSLHHRGIFDPEDPANAAAVSRAWEDVDAATIGLDYAALDADALVRLAAIYDAGYAITPAAYDDPRLVRLHAEAAPETLGSGRTLYLYQVKQPHPRPGGGSPGP